MAITLDYRLSHPNADAPLWQKQFDSFNRLARLEERAANALDGASGLTLGELEDLGLATGATAAEVHAAIRTRVKAINATLSSLAH